MDNEQLSEIFKSEYSNLIAVLCNYYGLADLQLAEDIVSETFLRATKAWSHKGIPNFPKAWLRKVAQNLLYEHYRRKKIYTEKIIPQLDAGNGQTNPIEITDKIIEDSQLQMLFVLCDPKLNNESQLCIALRILCGFSIDEIAKALLSNRETITKRIYRAKKAIKERNRIETNLAADQYVSRLDNVLRVIYLLFNEGYYSSVNEESIRHEICWEALRLSLFLSRQKIFPKPKIYALIALMCFHASRLDARTFGEHGDLLYHEQDKGKWDKDLIQKGRKYLKRSAAGNEVTKYHLEAAIAYWHTEETKEKWNSILALYDQLLAIAYSPIIAMNRTYAMAKANSVDEAIQEAHKLELKENHHYFCLLAELYRMKNNTDMEMDCLHKAMAFANKKNEKELIQDRLEKARG
ncbi:sigma-70 family RNA polymerase sigma factor [Muricauda sp. SCSIO 64092]|uniref:RNA polymerase sigma factor n=1 Tax=Allomuricauda sp. SCSIO 64092 TaxID=2908842 RepID=UPI001FF106F2|nr:sigma-70 family RNA polymerase sigma factor [Muricauda sp. SCSIO 64092]UOY06659.1 sigma-70 family RNA polymerase sigma factor [Muricauda sp. SCSIO 64092]